MAVLTAKTRGALPDSVFALPGRRYPINDRAHAIAAKSYASRYASPAEKRTIDAKADRMLGKGSGDAVSNRRMQGGKQQRGGHAGEAYRATGTIGMGMLKG